MEENGPIASSGLAARLLVSACLFWTLPSLGLEAREVYPT
jgi:hypothetical protein